MQLEISKVQVGDRFREKPGNLGELAESLKKYGQLQPILVREQNGSFELVAGFRRLNAAMVAGWTHIEAVTRDTLTELDTKEMELEENVRRLDMTWQERAKAIAAIDEIKKRQDPNWSSESTAVAIGSERRADVVEAIRITKMMELFPELKAAKSLNQALSWASQKASSVVRIKEVRDNPAEFKTVNEKLWLDDSVEAIKRVPSGSFRAIVTDPPFGINYDSRKAGTEQANTAYQDDEKSYERLLTMAPELFRVLKDDGFLIWFLGPTWYERVKLTFRTVGFTVDEMPIIWDRSDGRCFTTRPDRYFARGYDMALHCIKGNPEITAYGRAKPNVLRFAPLGNDERELLVERPVEMYAELIQRLTVKGETVADFFVGSGSVLAAAAATGRDYFGVERDPERHAYAIKKIQAHTP